MQRFGWVGLIGPDTKAATLVGLGGVLHHERAKRDGARLVVWLWWRFFSFAFKPGQTDKFPELSHDHLQHC